MIESKDVVEVWQRAGSVASPDRLHHYAKALTADCPIGAYMTLNDAQEDKAILALFCVDRPRGTIATLHQVPPLALSVYHQLLHDLAREGFGPNPECPAEAHQFGQSATNVHKIGWAFG